MPFERRSRGEVRAEGRRLTGTVLRYSDMSPSHRERFEPGALHWVGAVHLDLHHDPERAVAWQPGGGLKLTADRDAVRMVAELPPIPAADRALAEVRAGHTTGLSVEFVAEAERRDSGLRVIERAVLNGIGLVKAPSYGQSRVEARARSGRRLRSSIPYDRELACDCIAKAGPGSGGTCVPMVRFQQAAGEAMARAVREAMENPQGRDVLAVYKDYSRPIASARKGSLRTVEGTGGLAIELDLPTGEAGDMAVSASEVAGLIVRPLIDYEAEGTRYTDTPQGRVVEAATVRAFLVGSTDARQGWPDAEIDYTGEDRSAPAKRRRRFLL